MQFGLVWSIVVYNQQTTVTRDNPVLTVKGTDTPVQVANSDFTVRSDGSLASRSGGTTTMTDVLNYRAELDASGSTTTDSAGRRRLLVNCANGSSLFDWNNQNCQDDSFVTNWQTALNIVVSPSTCYFRTWEFRRASGACYNWYSPGKTFRNSMGVTGSAGNYTEALFKIASSTFHAQRLHDRNHGEKHEYQWVFYHVSCRVCVQRRHAQPCTDSFGLWFAHRLHHV